MPEITFTITLCSNTTQIRDMTVIMLEDDTVSTLTQHLSKNMYGGMPVCLVSNLRRIDDNVKIKSCTKDALRACPR